MTTTNAVTYTNTAARVTFTFGHAHGVLVSCGGKLSYPARKAEDFIEALTLLPRRCLMAAAKKKAGKDPCCCCAPLPLSSPGRARWLLLRA
jgi:hypothetical protein